MLTASRGVLATFLVAASLVTGTAHADSPAECGNLEVCIPGSKPAGPGTGGTGSNPGSGTGDVPQECSAGGAKYECHSELRGEFDQASGCYSKLRDPQPPASHPAWQGHEPGTGAIWEIYCPLRDEGYPVWRAGPANGPTAAELAQQVLAKLRLDPPPIHLTPGPGKPTLVSLPVWLWTDHTPHTWGPLTETASAPGLSVTGTATATTITWNMGDGTTVTCGTPGTPYSGGSAPSPDCGHAYQRISDRMPGGAYTVTATTTWSIPWQATNGQSGTFTATRTASVGDIRVGELQALNN